MRVLLAAAAMAALVALPGCTVLGCVGDARWTEPGIFAWMEQHGEGTGFSRGQAPPDMVLETGPRIAAALPPGGVLMTASYRERAGGYTALDLILLSNGTSVMQQSEAGQRLVSADRMVRLVERVLGPIYRGPPEVWETAVQQLRDQWPRSRQDPYSAGVWLNLSGPWDLDARFPPGTRFEPMAGSYTATVGDTIEGTWDFSAVTPSWSVIAEGYRSLATDTTDMVEVTGPMLSAAKAKDLARSSAPDYPWTFQDFHFWACS